MKTFKEKVKAIWNIMKADQYALYVMEDAKVSGNDGEFVFLISDNSSDTFLEGIMDFTDKYIVEKE